VADRVDRRVDAASVGPVLHRGANIILREVKRLGAVSAGALEPIAHRVDRVHPLGARGPRRLHGAEPDRSEAEHGHGVPGAHPTLGDRVVRGAHHVAGE
jgi:hypothetical protein